MILKRALAALVVCLTLPYACAPIYRFPAPRPFTGPKLWNPYASLSGTWHRANLHAHGRAWAGVTNGRQSDMDVLAAYRARGYDVPGISDYQSIAAKRGVPTLPIYEHGYNVGKHHQLAIGATAVEWFDFPLWQGVNQKQYVIDRVKSSAALVAVNHPSALGGYSYSDDDLQRLTGYQLIEVVNGRFPAANLWDAALSAGRVVWGLGNDDNHDITDPNRMAVAWNMIDAPSARTGDIVAALRDGRSYTVARPNGDGPADVTVSSVAEDDRTLTVTLAGPASTMAFIGQNGVVRKEIAHASAASYTFAPDDTYIRTEIRTPQVVLYLNPIMRYDGASLPVIGNATVDAPRTWLLRLAILAGCAWIGWKLGRRQPPREAGADAAGRLRKVSSIFFAVAAFVAVGAPASAQTAVGDRPGVGTGPPLGSTLTIDLLRDLPTADNLFSVLETTQAEIISDRISEGGLEFGRPARIGAFGSSSTQTLFRIGDVNITDPAGSGTPLVFPELGFWQRVSVTSGAMPPDLSTPGMAITLEPLRPTAAWTTRVDGSTSFNDALTATAPVGGPPSIARLHRWNRGSVLVSGPIVPNRVGVALLGSYTDAAQTDRSDPSVIASKVASGFANIVFAPGPAAELQTVAWLQRVQSPSDNRIVYANPFAAGKDQSAHVQSTWRQTVPIPIRVFGSYTQRTEQAQSAFAPVVAVERLTDGPPQMLAQEAPATARRWSIGARVGHDRPPQARQTAQLGIDFTGMRMVTDPIRSREFHETVDGLPARIWHYSATSGGGSRRDATVLSAFAADRLTLLPGVQLEVATRYEAVRGSADGAVQGIKWSNVLPRGTLRIAIAPSYNGSLFASYARTAYQLRLDDLAWGDQAAQFAFVSSFTSPALWVVGPGGAGRIDPDIKRPYSDDLVIGVDAQPRNWLRLQLAAVGKWEKQLLGVVNEANPGPAYVSVPIDDPGLDLVKADDDQQLPAASVVPASLSQSRFAYTLTNPADSTARLLAMRFTAEAQTPRLFFMLGATAFLADGVAGYQGFHGTENDPGVPGDVYTDPNAGLFSRGRLFNDRAYTIKLTSIYRFPGTVTLGAIARYQDGQPFSRLVIATNLAQGPEPIRAFANGGSRFTYTGTLDVRLQKEFLLAGTRIALVADGYNIVNLGNEVEERVVTGPAFRTITALQPPLTFRLGLRFAF